MSKTELKAVVRRIVKLELAGDITKEEAKNGIECAVARFMDQLKKELAEVVANA